MFLLIVLAKLLPNTTTHTVYTVTPDDHYYPNPTCHHCHNLQHYLLNVTNYFTSNTQLLFLPGLHHLHTDLIIQNVYNISLIGSTTNGTTLDTVIIQCNSSVGITLSNITDLIIAKLVIKNCEIKKITSAVTIKFSRWIFIGDSMILSNCHNVQLQNIALYKSNSAPSDQLNRCAVLAINVLGNSSFINLTSSALIILYSETNVHDKHNKLFIENYLVSPHTTVFIAIITINLGQKSYKVELTFYNTKFNSTFQGTPTLFSITQTANTFGNFIHFDQLTAEKFKYELSGDLFSFVSTTNSYEIHNQVTFTNCIFRNNKIGRLFTVTGTLNMELKDCVFEHSQFQVIRETDSSYQNFLLISNTSFFAITCTTNSSLIYISSLLLYLEGPIIFSKVKAERILYIKYNSIRCHGYIEFSENTATFNDYTNYITVYVQDNTVINMTNNEYSNIFGINRHYNETFLISNTTILLLIPYHEAFSISNFTVLCYYQYTAEGQNFDQYTEN